MLNLTFGEQVKIILSRKGLTIKELAEMMEATTGNKMSRQNLTQRLSRDNFQEQDMRIIAEILGCSFQLSILADAQAVQRASVIEEELPTEKEMRKLEAKKERKKALGIAIEVIEREDNDITVGELVEMIEHPEEKAAAATAAVSEEPIAEESVSDAFVSEGIGGEDAGQDTVEEATEEVIIEETIVEETIIIEEVQTQEEEQQVPEEKQSNIISMPRKEGTPKAGAGRKFEPIKKNLEDDENTELGEINPYSGHEYRTNSVRVHPRRIGYVQVYDRKEHKWTDMTEWAFLGVEEQKKAKLGKDYEPPVYLD